MEIQVEIFPLADGGILLLFQRERVKLEIEIDAGGSATATEVLHSVSVGKSNQAVFRSIQTERLSEWFDIVWVPPPDIRG